MNVSGTDPRARALRAALARHEPLDAQERSSLAETLRALVDLERPLDEDAGPLHVTASAIVLRDDGTEVLLHRHKRLGILLQPGGHIEPNESPLVGAIRETHEETGVTARPCHADGPLIHVDAHPGPRGHRHLDLRYLLVAESRTVAQPAPGESADVRWMPLEAAFAVADRSLAVALRAARDRFPGA